MNDLEIIENYLTGQLSADERIRFETTLRTDSAVADALAFYVLARHTARADARQQRQAELDALRRRPNADYPALVAPKPAWSAPMYWVSAASIVLLLGLAWSIFRLRSEPVAAAQLADTYIETNFAQLSTTMSGGLTDSLKMGVGLYNDQKFAEAETVFTEMFTRQPANDRALQYAGIAALRQGANDQAIERFHALSERTDRFGNPGPFLEALARLKRGRPSDKDLSRKLLDKVITNNLEGKSEAEQLVKNL